MANTRHNPTLGEPKAGDVVRVIGCNNIVGTCTGRYTERGRFISNNLTYWYEVDFGSVLGIKVVDVDILEIVAPDATPLT